MSYRGRIGGGIDVRVADPPVVVFFTDKIMILLAAAVPHENAAREVRSWTDAVHV